MRDLFAMLHTCLALHRIGSVHDILHSCNSHTTHTHTFHVLLWLLYLYSQFCFLSQAQCAFFLRSHLLTATRSVSINNTFLASTFDGRDTRKTQAINTEAHEKANEFNKNMMDFICLSRVDCIIGCIKHRQFLLLFVLFLSLLFSFSSSLHPPFALFTSFFLATVLLSSFHFICAKIVGNHVDFCALNPAKLEIHLNTVSIVCKRLTSEIA